MSPDAPDLITVSALLARVESRIETLATGWWITGEVAEAKVSAANHCYFTLRDEGGQIRCVLFAGVLKSLEAAGDFEIRAGDKLEVAGSLMVYPRSGDLQLRVLRVRRAGMGALYEAFLRLRAKLEAEGLFRPERKKPLPAFVRHVCVLTSSKGAALHDVLTTLKRRTPWIRITFANVLVQGADAPGSICRGLRAADECGADLLLLVRGGGSFEDLNAFNDETLARTIASLKTPVIAGIGHETDVTIAELVADRRASTPTAAAARRIKTRRARRIFPARPRFLAGASAGRVSAPFIAASAVSEVFCGTVSASASFEGSASAGSDGFATDSGAAASSGEDAFSSDSSDVADAYSDAAASGETSSAGSISSKAFSGRSASAAGSSDGPSLGWTSGSAGRDSGAGSPGISGAAARSSSFRSGSIFSDTAEPSMEEKP